jgi:hypothetical protein
MLVITPRTLNMYSGKDRGMIVMAGHTPVWCCDRCHGPVPVGSGFAVYSQASMKGHFPMPQLVCGEPCATLAALSLTVHPITRMPFAAFLTALTSLEIGR